MLRANYGRFNQGVLTGELSPIHPGVTADHDDGVRRGDRRLHNVSCRWSIRISISRSIPTPARPTPTSSRWLSIARSRRAWPPSAAYIRKRGSDFIGWTDIGRPVSGGDADARRRPYPAGVRAHQWACRPALPADEPRQLFR